MSRKSIVISGPISTLKKWPLTKDIENNKIYPLPKDVSVTYCGRDPLDDEENTQIQLQGSLYHLEELAGWIKGLHHVSKDMHAVYSDLMKTIKRMAKLSHDDVFIPKVDPYHKPKEPVRR